MVELLGALVGVDAHLRERLGRRLLGGRLGEDERPLRVDNRVLLLRVELALEDRAALPHLDE